MSTYELEAPGDVHSMSSSSMKRQPWILREPERSAAASATLDREEVQRMTLIRSSDPPCCRLTPVVPRGVRAAKDYVSVQIKEVVRGENSLYVRFAVTN